MVDHPIVLLGGPDSGKTNYLARLWEALRSGEGALKAPQVPDNINYVEDALAHLLQGGFAPRSDKNFDEANHSFFIPVVPKENAEAEPVQIVVPDVTGELWNRAVETCELPTRWMANLQAAIGALLFVRIGSDQNVAPVDWVATAKVRRLNSVGTEENRGNTFQIPTAVLLCELLRFLEHSLADKFQRRRPRVAVLVTAWDILHPEDAEKGPVAFLNDEYPLFAGKLGSVSKLDVRVFGTSVVGGDFHDEEFKQQFLQRDLRESGYVVCETDKSHEVIPDITLPVAWVFEGLDDK